MTAIDKYLQNYSEIELDSLADFPTEKFYKHCLVIPAFDESPHFIERLDQQLIGINDHDILNIIVINQPDKIKHCQANDALWDYLHQDAQLLWHKHNLFLMRLKKNDFLIVDRFRQTKIPIKQGVGLARKIGTDIAATLIHRKQCLSPWIHSTDADAYLPNNYFTAGDEFKTGYSAFLYRFQHDITDPSKDPITQQATKLYETGLHYYVNGLQWAASPYAFHTIGSLLAIHYDYYCQSRGFPKKAGGEDFYLLNKLSKLAKIGQTEAMIILESRRSLRVPFGTGPAVDKIIEQQQMQKFDYDPKVFIALKSFLQTTEQAIINGSDLSLVKNLFDEPTQAAVTAMAIDKLITHLDSLKAQQKITHFHHWFDAFRTLKFVHFLQENYHPKMLLQTALEQAPFDQTGVTKEGTKNEA